VESPVLSNGHAGFGGRPEETDQSKGWHRALGRPNRDRGASHNTALRQLANRLVGILHGCLKNGALYDEATAWPDTRRPVSVVSTAGG
jgi:hypothetical protein